MTIDIPLLLFIVSAVLAAIALVQSEGKALVAWAVLLTDVALLWARWAK